MTLSIERSSNKAGWNPVEEAESLPVEYDPLDIDRFSSKMRAVGAEAVQATVTTQKIPEELQHADNPHIQLGNN